VAVDVVIPEVGEMGMDVVFVRWRKRAGDAVEVGDILFELDTEKTVVEVEAWTAGTLSDLRVTDGDLVTPRQVVARIVAAGEATPDEADGRVEAASTPSALRADADSRASVAPSAAASADGPSLSPRARALARELGIDPSAITGTGPGGMVTEQDIRMAAARGGHLG
jgi:pyruvate/2-oxoglutarate dehydrogenase complex dihydrolipoamide acyltransferase (E2) component